MSTNFEEKLHQILNQSPDNLDESNEEHETEPGPMLPVVYDKKESSVELTNPDIKADYDAARSNMYGLMGKTNAAVELALKIAQMSEHPRALEVAANLIKTSSDISKDLVQLHKQLEQKQGKGGEAPTTYQQVNNYYTPKEEKDNAELVIDDLPDTDED